MTLSVVIPVYNEEENIRLLYEKLKNALDPLHKEYEILFIDDGSTDRTLSILEEIQAKDNNLIVLSLRRNFGQTAAFRGRVRFCARGYCGDDGRRSAERPCRYPETPRDR